MNALEVAEKVIARINKVEKFVYQGSNIFTIDRDLELDITNSVLKIKVQGVLVGSYSQFEGYSEIFKQEKQAYNLINEALRKKLDLIKSEALKTL